MEFLREKSVCENTFLKIYLPSAKKSKLPSHQDFGVFALEVNEIVQATPSKLRREMGMCAPTMYLQQQQYYFKRGDFFPNIASKCFF